MAWTKSARSRRSRKIRAAQERVPGIRLLAGIEVDILKNGKLDLDDEVLAQLDVVVASMHSYMNMERAEMTDRILAAIENPYTQIVAHPTGRLVLRRDPFEYDMEKVFDAAAKNGVAMECNAYPDRLDLKDVHLRMAKQRGVQDRDFHRFASREPAGFMQYGVSTARRGWIEKKDVINTLPLPEFLAALRPKPHSAAATATATASRREEARAGETSHSSRSSHRSADPPASSTDLNRNCIARSAHPQEKADEI